MKLHTNALGSGPLHIAMVHGLGGSGDTWRPLIDLLLATDRFTITTLDLRGHGLSDRATSYALDDFADDVVENLPTHLHAVVGHSLGGPVLARAVGRLEPQRAIYLDPGFHLALPTAGIRAKLFWLAPTISLGAAQLLQLRKSAEATRAYTPETRQLIKTAQQQFDSSMAIGVFRDAAFHPIAPARPAVPSTIILSDDSDDSAAILPDAVASKFQAQGWDVERMPNIHHDMQLEDPARVFEALNRLL